VGRKHIGALLAAVLALPLVAAADFSNVTNAVNKMFGLFGAFFNVQLPDPILEGLARGLYFLVLFALINYILRQTRFKDDQGKRTANIISFALALIAAFFIPAGLMTNLASYWSAFFVALGIIILPLVALIWSFRPKKDGRTASEHLMGAALIALAWAMTAPFRFKVLPALSTRPGIFGDVLRIILENFEIAVLVGVAVKVFLAVRDFTQDQIQSSGGMDWSKYGFRSKAEKEERKEKEREQEHQRALREAQRQKELDALRNPPRDATTTSTGDTRRTGAGTQQPQADRDAQARVQGGNGTTQRPAGDQQGATVPLPVSAGGTQPPPTTTAFTPPSSQARAQSPEAANGWPAVIPVPPEDQLTPEQKRMEELQRNTHGSILKASESIQKGVRAAEQLHLVEKVQEVAEWPNTLAFQLSHPLQINTPNEAQILEKVTAELNNAIQLINDAETSLQKIMNEHLLDQATEEQLINFANDVAALAHYQSYLQRLITVRHNVV
jgi:hypothetical protein